MTAKKTEKKDKTEDKKRVVLLDTHAILHRAYHALPDFMSSKGEPTGGLYGLATMILKIIEDLKPSYVIACYDLPHPTYRHEAYKDYKAGRAKSDDELVAQIKRSRDLMNAFSIPMYDKPGFEADDMLGTICEQIKLMGEGLGESSPSVSAGSIRATSLHAPSNQLEVVIASGDMDTLQLVDDKKIQVYTLKKGIKDTILYDEEAVKERFGFGPALLPDYKGLRGDPSDNIIGIKGIGEKTATILITKFGTIENIYNELKKDTEQFKKAGITERIIGLLKEGEEEAQFSKMLATIRKDAPIEFQLPEKEWRESVDMKKVEELFKELEFRSLGVRVKEVLGLTDAFGMTVSGGLGEVSPSVSTGSIRANPLHAPTTNGGISSGVKNIGALVGAERISASETEIGTPISSATGAGELEETALALWVLDSNITNPQLEDILNFANTDSFAKAKEIIFKKLEESGLKKIYDDIELPLLPATREMHERGIKVDVEYLKKLSVEYHIELKKLEEKIWELAGSEFNINSPKQLGEVLFVEMGLKAKNQKKTAGGALSTRESELEKMKDLHPIIAHILNYRELQKLLSTYIDSIPTLVDESGRLHATFIQSGTTTGRMSSQNPNLQNIPIKSELGRRIRNAFVSEKGFKLASFDYSQIELRVAAFLSGDKGLIEIFKSGRDVHTEVAARVFKVAPEKVDKEMRRKAKVINFGILFGMGVNALKQNLNVSREESQLFLNEYFNTFSGLASYLENVKAETAKRGYTETFLGRRRKFEGINSKIPFIRASAERMAINAPIQGTEADIIKLAMIHIDSYLKKEKLEEKVRLLLQVHDELVFEIADDTVEKIAPKIRELMQNVLTLKETQGVPILTSASAGANWGDLKEL